MRLLQLAYEFGITPKRVASTNGGEYHSPCPSCGGKDRFIIWDSQSRYFCRRCEAKGDQIQFCRDFMGMSYAQACQRCGKPANMTFTRNTLRVTKFIPSEASEPPLEWQNRAQQFVVAASHLTRVAKHLFEERLITTEMINRFALGWNASTQFDSYADWGLTSSSNEKGREKRVWLPRGIVIPTFEAKQIMKLKVRRSDWHEHDQFPKYVEITGSRKSPSLYGGHSDVWVIVESELDAMLVQQYANDLCCCLALGGASKKPDKATHERLAKAAVILFALDFDDAGKGAYRFWRTTYPRIRAWPIPRGKSPGDALKLGVDLRSWVAHGIERNSFTKN